MSVSIPAHSNHSGTRYFTPRFVKIVVGNKITWYNTNDESHSLIFDKEIPPYDIKIGDVNPKSTFSRSFDSYVPRIDYSCATHPEEKGTIVIYPKEEVEMTNTETLRHLYGFMGRQPPEILGHLAHKPTVYGKTVLPEEVADHISLEKFLDPYIHKILGNPELYQLQSKKMTIVFWDVSSFSDLCNVLNKQPILITGFLRDYFDMAIKTIHDHGGVVDKFIGDGILSFFGYESDQVNGANDAVKSALELRQMFEEKKRIWMEMWSKDFDHNKISIDLKCGIHTGSVLFGLLDTDSRSQITLLGSTVNLASRLESIAKNNQIIISAEVKDVVQDKYEILAIQPKNRIQSYPEIDIVYEVKSLRT